MLDMEAIQLGNAEPWMMQVRVRAKIYGYRGTVLYIKKILCDIQSKQGSIGSSEDYHEKRAASF